MPRRLLFGFVCFAAILGLLLLWSTRKSDTNAGAEDAFTSRTDSVDLFASSEQLWQDASLAFERKDFRTAEELASRVPQSSVWATSAYRLAGESAAHQRKFDEAIAYFDQMTDAESPEFLLGNLIAADILLNVRFRMSEAEQRLRRVLQIDPQHGEAHLAMYHLLSACARRREMVPHILAAMRQGRFLPQHLIALGSETRLYKPPPLLEPCSKNEPEYVGVMLGLAQAAINQGESSRARQLLERAVRIDPTFLAAQSRLGALRLEEENPEAFIRWQQQLPSHAEDDPDIWFVRGEWAEREQQRPASIRCYWEAIRRDPNLRTAVFRLAKLLAAEGEHDRAKPFLDRAHNLQLLKEQEARLNAEGATEPLVREIAAQTEKLGRVWESWGWCQVALQRDPTLVWARQQSVALETVLKEGSPQTLASANPARQTDLSDFPLPNWSASSPLPAIETRSNAMRGTIAFQNVASTAGLNFTYFGASSSPETGRKMYELTGGGVAVIDFDQDGWPDTYLTQGCAWPPREDVVEHLDRLFQNRSDGTVVDVTSKAGVVENRFSQGVAVGDFDNDGFSDILVANIGRNRLYRNNGDGTFQDATGMAGFEQQDWTTSCVICDVNGDGLPDVYEVNYLQGSDIFQMVCQSTSGQPRMCKPTSFEAAQDRLHLNLGDGRFQDITDRAGIRVAGGKGLGVVAADFDASGRLSLFVANDTRANFYFQNQTPQRGDSPVFVEQAYSNGLALNGEGLAEGCMGIAIGDADRDRNLDLFVTNYYRETNTFYLQTDGVFDDATRRARLEQDSTPMVGFGTQFIDADLNGALDLIVTNGHIDDLRDEGEPFQMPAQFYCNEGAHFRLLPPVSLGEYFEGTYLGRALARLDWNRDGREDILISHLDEPAALLENVTSDAGHALVIKLRGTRSDRDAIGATVTADAGGSVFVHQLTAGDGYQASNQRMLVLGLGAARSIDRLHVRWPSGLEQAFADVAVDREVLLVEGASQLVTTSPHPVP